MKHTYCFIIVFLIFSCKDSNHKPDSKNSTKSDALNFENIVGAGYLNSLLITMNVENGAVIMKNLKFCVKTKSS
jgi:hypothetical protein